MWSRGHLAIASKIGDPVTMTGRFLTEVWKFPKVLQISSMWHWGSFWGGTQDHAFKREQPHLSNTPGSHKGEVPQGSSYCLFQQDDGGTVDNPAEIWGGSETGCTELAGCLAGRSFKGRISMKLERKGLSSTQLPLKRNPLIDQYRLYKASFVLSFLTAQEAWVRA